MPLDTKLLSVRASPLPPKASTKVAMARSSPLLTVLKGPARLPMMNPTTFKVPGMTATTAHPILLSLGSEENFPPDASVAKRRLFGSKTGQ
eukprot:11905923-Heterocapsa_arctica.AAC.1